MDSSTGIKKGSRANNNYCSN